MNETGVVVFADETPINVVPNAIPKYFWGNKKRMQ
jgi:hypothetical protein